MRHTAAVLSSNFVAALAVVGVSAVERQRLKNDRMDRGSRNPSPIKAPTGDHIVKKF